MASLFRRVSERWAYDPVRTYSEDSTFWRNRKSGQYRLLLIGLATAFGFVVGFLFAKSFLFRTLYNPLDNYQNINQLPVTIGNGVPRNSPSSRRAVVSSLYSDAFAIAVAVVGHSARSANVSARLLLPYLDRKVSEKALCIVRATGWEPYAVPFIPPPKGGKGIYPRFQDVAVYVDADTLVRLNFDELFDSPFNFAAVPDVYGAGDPRGFSLSINTGVLAFRPSSKVFEDMRRKIEIAEYPYLQADQAFLNLYFGGTAMRLPYIYNANLAIKSRSPVLWRRLADEMRIVHYTTLKPFLDDSRPSDTILSPEEMKEALERAARREGGFFREEVAWWRDAYERMMADRGHAIGRCYRESL
ncbi:glycosyltransferase family 8 protein [Mycena galericulata]|nr:glycosyltransferase family 8 protein [Mycena galericulata]